MKRMDYESAKAKWEQTKPIRGRAVDIRPIGKRSRDQETIVKVDLGADKPEGERWAYAAKLYNTNVVTWYPDSTMGIKVDTYHTPSTAKFIHEVSPLGCAKANRKLWVWAYGTGSGSIKYPVPHKDEMRMGRQADGTWAPLEGYTPKIRRTDRKATKPLQQQVAPFLNWAKAFLSMADGYIQPETYEQALEVKVTRYGTELNGWERTEIKLPADIAQRLGIADANAFMLANNTKSETTLKAVLSLTEDDYLPFLCFLSRTHSPFQPAYITDKVIHPVYIKYDKLKEWVYKLIRNAPQSGKEVEFTPSAKVSRNMM